MIVGLGIDVVDLARFAEALERTPALRRRVFTPVERPLPLASLGARFAAKEALAKALGAPAGLSWLDAEIRSQHTGRPYFEVKGSVQRQVTVLGADTIHVSLSHDAGIASAVVVLEAR